MSKTALLSAFSSFALVNVIFCHLALAEPILRTAACSTLSKVSYDGRDYSVRNYAVRHNLEWKTSNQEFDLQLHEELSDTFPPLATVVRNLVREAKGVDGRELSGSERAQVLGLYGTNAGPVVPPTRNFTYDWSSNEQAIRTDEVDGNVVGRYRVVKRKISDEAELIQQFLVEAPESGGGIVMQAQETSCFRFKQPRWMWSQLVPAPLETAAAGFDPVMYAADNAWNQLKECQAAKGSCETLEKAYTRAVEARDKVWNDQSTIDQLRDIGRKPGARGFALTRFPEDVLVDEQGWLVLDQGSGHINHLGEATTGENLREPEEAVQEALEQQQLLAEHAAASAQAEPSAAKPTPSVALEGRTSASPPLQPGVTRSPASAHAALHAASTKPPATRQSRIATHESHRRLVAARVQRAERTQPIPRVPPFGRMEPRMAFLPRVMRAPEDAFGAWMLPPRPRRQLEPQRYEVRMRREVSPFYFLFEN